MVIYTTYLSNIIVILLLLLFLVSLLIFLFIFKNTIMETYRITILGSIYLSNTLTLYSYFSCSYINYDYRWF